MTAERRRFLQLAGASLGASWLALDWAGIARAAEQAAAQHAAGGARGTTSLSADEAADVEAIAAQIIPTDATPGAREAGVLWFIDRALASFYAPPAARFHAGLQDFQAAVHAMHPDAVSFASLPQDQQLAFLQTVDHTPFFDAMRMLTVLGMFSMPAYGGNRDGVGWRLLGFEDLHAFDPPFGYYDRNYPGFGSKPESTG
jgi:gluconate 2-dehydrogenase gamma chain